MNNLQLYRISKQQKFAKDKNLPATEERFKLEVAHNCSVEIDRSQYNELEILGLAKFHKDKLVQNVGNSGKHRLFVMRLCYGLFNQCTVIKTYTGFLIRKLREFLDPILNWKYRSCIAILQAKQ